MTYDSSLISYRARGIFSISKKKPSQNIERVSRLGRDFNKLTNPAGMCESVEHDPLHSCTIHWRQEWVHEGTSIPSKDDRISLNGDVQTNVRDQQTACIWFCTADAHKVWIEIIRTERSLSSLEARELRFVDDRLQEGVSLHFLEWFPDVNHIDSASSLLLLKLMWMKQMWRN